MSIENRIIQNVLKDIFAFSREITVVAPLSYEKLQFCIQEELRNNPELFFVNGFRIAYNPIKTMIYPNYCYDESTFHTKYESCKKTASQLVLRINATTDYDKALQAHDFLAKNVLYVNGFDKELHSIVGPFTKKQGVCEGFAKAYKYMLDLIGISNVLIYGYAVNIESGVEESHTWNMVQMDGHWLHIDVTFDTTIRKDNYLRYDYFGLTNNQILKDHRYEVKDYPISDKKGLSYYENKGLVMNTRQQMKDYLSSGMARGEKNFVFKIPDNASDLNLEDKVESEVREILLNMGLTIGYSIYFNLKQHVFHICFER